MLFEKIHSAISLLYLDHRTKYDLVQLVVLPLYRHLEISTSYSRLVIQPIRSILSIYQMANPSLIQS